MLKSNGIIVGALSIWMACCFSFPAKAQNSQVNEDSPLNRVGWLVGNWVASNVANGEPTQVHLAADWSTDKSSIHVSCTQIAGDGQPQPQYEATYSWDPQKKKIVVTETRANGDRFEGTVLAGGKDFVQSGRLTHSSGASAQVSIDYNQWAPGTLNITTTPEKGDAGATTAAENLVFLLQKPS